MVDEIIICAAIWFPKYKKPVHSVTNLKEGLVMCGHRHCHIIGQHGAFTGGGMPAGAVQGFLTSRNRFVDRKEARQIAEEMGQVFGSTHSTKDLFSEDLY